MKKIWITSVLCVSILLMVGCTNSKTPVKQTTPKVNTQTSSSENTKPAVTEPQVSTQAGASSTSNKDLTLDELKKYNGQNGNLAYISVDGVIYDVTNAPGWKNGQHQGGGATAGMDLSKAINTAPHGKDVLVGLPVIGKIK